MKEKLKPGICSECEECCIDFVGDFCCASFNRIQRNRKKCINFRREDK